MPDETFKIGDVEYPVRVPMGRKGRKAAAAAMRIFSSSGNVGGPGSVIRPDDIFSMITDDEFEEKYLADFIGVPHDRLEDEGSVVEILTAVTKTVELLFEGFSAPEVEEAQKNLPEEQPTEE